MTVRCLISHSSIFHIHSFQVYSVLAKRGEKVSAEMIMTDGSGLINKAGMTNLFNSGVVNLCQQPSTIQFRFIGAKGMLLLHPSDNAEEPKIWIRCSQKKINLPTPLGREHCILELLCPSRVVTPSHLNTQVIMNMAHNGVPSESFSRLTDEDLSNTIRPLKDWRSPVAVAQAVYRLGRINGVRLQRIAPGNTRALGLARDFHREDQFEDDIEEELRLSGAQPPGYSGRCVFSGAPFSVHESAFELLLAGFQPPELEYLYKKIHSITALAVDGATKNLRITIAQSLEAYIIPGTHIGSLTTHRLIDS